MPASVASICGFLSYDTIMVLEDKFKYHFLGNNPLDIHFTVPDLRRQFGGSAGNIAYNLKLLDAEPLLWATVGADFGPYANWLKSQHIRCDHIMTITHCYTAQTFITIDMDDNYLSAFHPGAMSFSHHNRIVFLPEVTLGVVCADSVEGMTTHALQLIEVGVPFIFYPGKALAEFEGDELLKFVEQAEWLLVDQTESVLLQQRLALSIEQIAQHLQALIITQGPAGALIYTQDTCYQIPAIRTRTVMHDLDGRADAFCAGLLYGLLKDIDWETTGRIAVLMEAIKAAHHGTQSHSFPLAAFKKRFKDYFGYALII